MARENSFTSEAYIHYGYFINIAKKYTQNQMDAEDLVQETYAKAFKFYGSFKEGSNCRAWLYTIMKNTFFSYCRNNNNMTEVHIEEFPEIPDNKSESMLTREEILKFMDNINEEFKKVIVLFHLEEFSLKEISQQLKWPIGTVKSRLHRGRIEFREILNQVYVS